MVLTLSAVAATEEQPKRPVLMSAERLSTLCKSFLVIPVGYAENDTYTATPKQTAQALGCISYIEGVGDEITESAFENKTYTPQNTRLSDAYTLVDYFVKYVERHPEENNLAATTVLRECEENLEKLYGKPKP